MTSVFLQFENYPMFVNGTPTLCNGLAKIKLDQPLTYRHPDSKLRMVPTGKILRWRFEDIRIDGVPDDQANLDDARAFVRGRYWPKLDAMLYAEFITEADDPEYANVFRRLAA